MELTEGESNLALFSDVYVGNSLMAPCRTVEKQRLAGHLVIKLYVNFA